MLPCLPPSPGIVLPPHSPGIAVEGSFDSLSNWLDEHQHIEPSKQTRIILVDSETGSNYKFSVAFLLYVLEGEIDLSTNEFKNGSLYINVPLWGLVNMMDDISGNLGGTIHCQATNDPSIEGRFTLSLDQTERKLVIDYVFNIKFVGVVTDKIALFPLPAPGGTVSTERANNRTHQVTHDSHLARQFAESSSAPLSLKGCKSFDKFLAEHYDKVTHNFVVASYTPRSADLGISGMIFDGSSSSGPKSSGSEAYRFDVGFLSILELKGLVDPERIVSEAILYVTVPFWGRVTLATFSGSLDNIIQQKINIPIANGTVGLRLVYGKEVWIIVDLDIRSAGIVKDDMKLFDFPF